MRLLLDTTCPTPIAACPSCNQSWDLLTLAGKVWHTELPETVERLQAKGLLPNWILPRFESRQYRGLEAQRKAFQELTEKACGNKQLLVEPASLKLLATLRIRRESGLSWSADGLPKLAGVIDRVAAEDILRPRRVTYPRRHVVRPFKLITSHCDRLLVVPFYDAPGRVASVSLVGTKSSGAYDQQDISLNMQGVWEIPHGLAAHPKLFLKNGGPLLCTDNLELYLHLQAKAFVKGPDPLPLVCYRNTESPRVPWQLFDKRELVFLTPQISPKLLWRAIRTDAKIAIGGPCLLTPSEFIAKRDPLHVVSRHLRQARPWQDAIISLMDNKTDGELVDWFSAMELDAAEQQQLLDAAPLAVAERLSRLLSGQPPTLTVPVRDGYVEQQPSGWYFHRPGRDVQLITNHPFRILAATLDAKGIRYTVEVTHGDQPVVFQCDQKEFKTRPFEIIEAEMIAAGRSVPAMNADWERRAVYLSLQFHTPASFAAPRMEGHDSGRQQFCTASALLCTQSGVIHRLPAPDESLRGRQISPKRVHSAAMRRLVSRPMFADFVATTAGLAASWLSDIYRNRPQFICVHGTGAAAIVERLTADFECESISIDELDKIDDKWPRRLVAHEAELRDHRAQLLNNHPVVPVLIACDSLFAALAATAGHVAVEVNTGSLPTNYKELRCLGGLLFRLFTGEARRKVKQLSDRRLDSVTAVKRAFAADIYRNVQLDQEQREWLDRRLYGCRDLSHLAVPTIRYGYLGSPRLTPTGKLLRGKHDYLVDPEDIVRYAQQLGIAPAIEQIQPALQQGLKSGLLRQHQGQAYVAASRAAVDRLMLAAETPVVLTRCGS